MLDIWHTDLLNDGRKAAVQIAQSLIRTENTTSDNHSVSNEAIRKIIDVVVEIQVRFSYYNTAVPAKINTNQ